MLSGDQLAAGEFCSYFHGRILRENLQLEQWWKLDCFGGIFLQSASETGVHVSNTTNIEAKLVLAGRNLTFFQMCCVLHRNFPRQDVVSSATIVSSWTRLCQHFSR
jgi:hypothetical protein